jgi:hypothetical protein
MADPEMTSRPTNDAYTGMLAIALLALIAGSVLMFLDFNQYPNRNPPPLPKSKDVPVLPKAEPPKQETPDEKKDDKKDDKDMKKDDAEKKDDTKKDDTKKDDAKDLKKDEEKKDAEKKDEKKESASLESPHRHRPIVARRNDELTALVGRESHDVVASAGTSPAARLNAS